MLLSAAIEGFLLTGRSHYSSDTIAIYKWALSRLLIFLDDKELEEVTPDDLTRFISYLRTDYIPVRKNKDTSPLTSRSIENVWTAIRSFFRWSHEILSIQRPDLDLKRPEYEERVIIPFTREEVDALISACLRTKVADTSKRTPFTMPRPTAARDYAMVMVLMDTGMRVSELCRLNVQDVDLDTGEVIIEPFGTGRKTHGRTVYLGNGTTKRLWMYLTNRKKIYPTDPLFLSEDNRRMTRNGVRQLIGKLGTRAGIAHAHPHKFRHTFAIEFLRNGGDIFTLQRLLGTTLSVVLHYLDIAKTDVQNAHRRASPVDNWRL